MNSVKVIADSQKDAMERNIWQIFKSCTAIFIVSWGLVSLVYKVTPLLWWSGIAWLALVWSLCVCVLWGGDYLHQAHKFHLIASVAFLGTGLICWDAAVRLLLRTVDLYSWVCVVLFLVVVVIGTIGRALTICSRLQVHQKLNVASGRFRDDTHEWDLTAPMYLDTHKKTQAYDNFWRKIMPLSPIFVVLVARVLHQWETLLLSSGVIMGVLGALIVLGGTGLHLGVAFYLLKLKRQNKLPVHLLSDEHGPQLPPGMCQGFLDTKSKNL